MGHHSVSFTYKNHRGEVARRTVLVDAIEYLREPGYGYEPGWFIAGFDVDKQARRSFSFANIVLPETSTGWPLRLQLMTF